MGGTHDVLVENRDIHEELVESHVLLGIGPDQVVKLQSGDREYGLTVKFRIVEAV